MKNRKYEEGAKEVADLRKAGADDFEIACILKEYGYERYEITQLMRS